MIATVRNLVLASALVVPSLAVAAPITAGVWSAIGTPGGAGHAGFWDNLSDDITDPQCAPVTFCNAGDVLIAEGFGPGLEFLHGATTGTPVAFSFGETIAFDTPIFTLTTLNQGTPGQLANGAITYNTDPGQPGNLSWDSLTDPSQFALFRQVGPLGTTYFLSFEDSPFDAGDRDFNDLIMQFTQRSAPEPATMLLLGTALAGLGVRRVRQRRS